MAEHDVRPPQWIEGAPISVERSVEIGAPPSAVWAHIADHERWPEWFGALERVEPLGEPAGVGGGRRVIIRGRPIDETFTVWDVDEHFAFAVTSSSLPILRSLAESVRLAPTDAGTRVTYRQGLEARRGFGWLLRLMWKQPARQLADALGVLRQRVEMDRPGSTDGSTGESTGAAEGPA